MWPVQQGFVGAKSTPLLLPHCHPVAIDAMDIQFEFLDAVKHETVFGEGDPRPLRHRDHR